MEKKFRCLKETDLEDKIRLPNIVLISKTSRDEHGNEYEFAKQDVLLAIFDTAIKECEKNKICISKLAGYRILDEQAATKNYFTVEFYAHKR